MQYYLKDSQGLVVANQQYPTAKQALSAAKVYLSRWNDPSVSVYKIATSGNHLFVRRVVK